MTVDPDKLSVVATRLNLTLRSLQVGVTAEDFLRQARSLVIALWELMDTITPEDVLHAMFVMPESLAEELAAAEVIPDTTEEAEQ